MSSTLLKHCIVVTCFDPKQPGFLDFSYRLNALAKDYRLTIISQLPITQTELVMTEAEYVVIPITSGKIGWLKYLFQSASFIKKQKPDVVVLLHSALAPMSLLIPKVPTCLYWNEHPTNLMRYPSRASPLGIFLAYLSHALLYLGARHAQCVMPIGEEHHEDLLKHKVKPSKLIMTYMGVSEAFYLKQTVTALESPSDSIQLIYIGTVSEIRGRDVMLDAMALVAENGINAHLTIIGACDEQLNYCQQRIRDLNLHGFVTVLGRISGEKVPDYLQYADVGICVWEKNPWYEFNPPTKLFEYLAAGLPVLASNIRTHTRYIHDWKNGLVFEYDHEALAKAIVMLDRYKSRIKSLKQQAKLDGEQYAWRNLEPIFLSSMQGLVGD